MGDRWQLRCTARSDTHLARCSYGHGSANFLIRSYRRATPHVRNERRRVSCWRSNWRNLLGVLWLRKMAVARLGCYTPLLYDCCPTRCPGNSADQWTWPWLGLNHLTICCVYGYVCTFILHLLVSALPIESSLPLTSSLDNLCRAWVWAIVRRTKWQTLYGA